MVKTLSFACVLALVLFPSIAESRVNKDRMREIEREFKLEERKVRPDHLLLPVNYLEYEGELFSYYLPRRFVRLAHEGESFRLDKIKIKKRHVRLHLVSSGGAKPNLHLFDEDELSQEFLDHVLELILSELFEFREYEPSAKFCGNKASKVVHLSASNHLPADTNRVLFPTMNAASGAGFAACPVCFSDDVILPIEGYPQIRAQAIESARKYEMIFPPIDDETLQAELQARGEEIVTKLPVKTAGYPYRFRILQSELANATSLATGFVYITDTLLSMIEEPSELDFILAHEIAHCELNALRMLEFEEKIRWLPFPSYEAMQAHRLAVRRKNERVADLIAFITLDRLEDNLDYQAAAARVLRKLQFWSRGIPVAETERWDTHPSYGDRLELVDSKSIALCKEPVCFEGLSSDGAPLIRVTLLGKNLVDDDPWIYLLLETTDQLNKEISWKGFGRYEKKLKKIGKIVSDGTIYRLYVQGEGGVTIGQNQTKVAWGLLSSASEYHDLDVDGLSQLDLIVDGVKDWSRCE